MEKDGGLEIKVIRFDRGGEFTLNEIQELCEANGIRPPLTVSKFSRQNGLTEKKNISILDMVRSMLNVRGCQKNSGWKQSHVQCTCPTDHHQRVCWVKHHKKHRAVGSLASLIQDYWKFGPCPYSR